MLLSKEHKFCFVHIPRTGGASIRWALYPHSDLAITGKRPTMHKPLRKGEYTDYFKFTIVRNPWERYVSLWKFLRGRNDKEGLRHVTFDDFMHQHLMPKRFRYKFYPHNQMFYGVDLVDYVGRFEKLEKSFVHICKQIGIPAPTLQHRHYEGEYFYDKYYTDETRDFVAEYCKEEIERFNYEF